MNPLSSTASQWSLHLQGACGSAPPLPLFPLNASTLAALMIDDRDDSAGRRRCEIVAWAGDRGGPARTFSLLNSMGIYLAGFGNRKLGTLPENLDK